MNNQQEYHFLGKDDLLYFFDEEIKYAGTEGHLRDHEALLACVEAPRATFDGNYLHTVFGMAAKYVSSICIRHPFSDGNKRVAAIAATVFLEINGYDFKEDSELELAEKVLAFLAQKLNEDDLEAYFESNCA